MSYFGQARALPAEKPRGLARHANWFTAFQDSHT